MGFRFATAISSRVKLARAVNVPSRILLLPLIYRKLADFQARLCVDVQHAKDARFFETLESGQLPCGGKYHRDERREILSRFSQGEIGVLTNCNLLTEGFDEPRINSVIMARPTESKLLYAQIVETRDPPPEKTDLMVVDVADNSKHHTIPGLHSLFNLPMSIDEGRQRPSMNANVRRVEREFPWIDTSRLQKPEDIPRCSNTDERIAPAELAGQTEHVWYRATDSYRESRRNYSQLNRYPG